MKKLLSAVLAAILAVSLCACTDNSKTNSNNSSGTSQTESKAESKEESKTESKEESKTESKEESKSETALSVSDIEAKFKNSLGNGYLATSDVDSPLTVYGFDESKIEEIIAKEGANPSTQMDLVIVVKFKDGYKDEAVARLNDALSGLVDYVRQYAFDTEKVMNARVFCSGNYAALIVAGEKAGENMSAEDAAKLADAEYKKIDDVWSEMFGSTENLAVIPEENENEGEDDFFLGGDDDFFLGGDDDEEGEIPDIGD